MGIDEKPGLDPRKFSKPMDNIKKVHLLQYIQEHEQDDSYFTSDGQPCLKLNRGLVFLERGAGFGEMALMSETLRMASCMATRKSLMGTIKRKDFSAILSRA